MYLSKETYMLPRGILDMPLSKLLSYPLCQAEAFKEAA